ncbi:MAG TPA: AgmX/PglI C-terminal domain-containing protein [Polyangiales bacterium]|nr:AgmX/PglI C-terminal domain-containing protein [Polyangiales bacterium]
MDTSTFDLYRVLQSGPYDEAGLSQVKRLIGGQRRLLRGNSDWGTLEQLIQMLQDWARAAGGGWLGASALAEAAEIAELDLRNTARAEQLRSQAIVTGRAASGLPAAPPPVTNEGAIDANAELLHELKTLPPGALTQAFLTDAATEFEEEVRRSSSIPARPRTLPGAGPATELQAQRSSSAPPEPRDTQNVQQLAAERRRSPDRETVPMTPAEAAERQRAADAETVPFAAADVVMRMADADRTQEVHTIDLDLTPLTSFPPLAAADSVVEDALAAQIARAEQALDSDTSPDRVRELAELYVKRDEAGDREQAAVLYTTLGEVLGNPAGIAMLERALSLVPEHSEAKALLTRYTVRQRMPITSPKITVLGMQPRAAAAIPLPPPAAARAVPPLSAAAAVGQSPALMAPSLQPLAAVPARASAAPAARATLAGNGPANDVLPLHGVPQVVSTPPMTPQISSLTPVVRSDASQLQPESKLSSFKRLAVPSGLALSVAAAFGLYFASHAHRSSELPASAPSARAVLTNNASTPQVAAANQPLAAVPEVKAVPAKPAEEVAAAPRANVPAPLAPPAPSHLPALKIQAAKLSGGKLSQAQLSDALGKAESKFLACYAQASEKKPRMKGSVIYGFTVKTNGKVTNIKRVGGTLRDDSLTQCSVKVLEAMRFPKPRKQSAQVKLPIQYKRT